MIDVIGDKYPERVENIEGASFNGKELDWRVSESGKMPHITLFSSNVTQKRSERGQKYGFAFNETGIRDLAGVLGEYSDEIDGRVNDLMAQGLTKEQAVKHDKAQYADLFVRRDKRGLPMLTFNNVTVEQVKNLLKFYLSNLALRYGVSEATEEAGRKLAEEKFGVYFPNFLK